jgi:3-methyladenine DNA glycosylase/8-oxoguanine DNA glycosylase
VALLPIPQPYDFERSTDRFRAYGRDLATAAVDGALYRVVDGTEVRIAPTAGGVLVEPVLLAQAGNPLARIPDAQTPEGVSLRRSRAESATRLRKEVVARVSFLLGLPFDLAGFWAWARDEPVLGDLAGPLAGFRPPLQPDPWEAVVTSVTAQQVSLHAAFAVRSRLIERLGTRHTHAWAFPTRDRVATASEVDLVAVGFSRRKAEYVLGLARAELDLDALRALPDDEVVATLSAQRGLGRWSADWFLARALARPNAWPAGDLGLRKAASHFYGEGRMLDESEVRELGERFGAWRNLAAHALLAGLRVSG